MKVTLETHGGQAAAMRLGSPPKVLDTAVLPPDAAAELTELVAAAGRQAEKERPPDRARDAMSYTITVEDSGGTSVLTGSDTTMTPPFAALLDWLETHVAGR